MTRATLTTTGLLCALGGAFLCCGATVERRSPHPQGPVEAVLPVAETRLLAAVKELFNDGLDRRAPNKFPATDFLADFRLYPRQVPAGYGWVGLPDDAALKSGSAGDPAMDRYLALPAERRRGDLFLYHAGERYWPSEYADGGRAVDFTCDFILHIEPAGEGRTRVEVLEHRPTVRVGRKVALSAHGVGIGRVDDVRLVPPTVADRQQLLARIAAAAADGR